jgi:hypothetical protein
MDSMITSSVTFPELATIELDDRLAAPAIEPLGYRASSRRIPSVMYVRLKNAGDDAVRPGARRDESADWPDPRLDRVSGRG